MFQSNESFHSVTRLSYYIVFLTASSSAFMSLVSGNKQPRLSVKVTVPKIEQKNQME